MSIVMEEEARVKASPSLVAPAERLKPAWMEMAARGAGPAIVGVVFIVLLIWTWGRWADPVIDFGRELYVPWQVARGKVLYRDVISFYGPLSPLFNALWFRLFGASVLTLVTVNSMILAMATALLYGIVREVGTRLAATVCGVIFLGIFGMAHLMPVGNFNFITPYSHEATHGFTLCLAALYFLARYGRKRKDRWLWGMGMCAGLAFLTKPEFFVAIAGALVAGVGLLSWRDGYWRKGMRAGGLVLAAGCLPMIAALAFMSLEMPWREAWRGALGSWLFMANSTVTGSVYFKAWMGFEQPGRQLMHAAAGAGWIAAAIAPGLLMAWRMRDGGRGRRFAAGVAGAMLAGAAAFLLSRWQAWGWAGNALLILVPLLLAWQCILMLQEWRRGRLRDARIVRLTLIVFGGLLLLKLGFYPRFHHYGFVLAGPALAMLIVAGLEWMPAWLERRGRAGWALRGAMLTLLAGVLALQLITSDRNMNQMTYPLGTGNDALTMDIRARTFDDAMAFLRRDAKPADTLTVLPEGALLNFLTRRSSPVPYVSFVPSDFTMFGEEKLLAALEKGRPTYLAIVDRPTSSMGPAAFGVDYGQNIRAWAMKDYAPVHLSGGIPFTGQPFGILLLRRKEPREPGGITHSPRRDVAHPEAAIQASGARPEGAAE